MKKLSTWLTIAGFAGLVYQPGKGNVNDAEQNCFKANTAQFLTGDIVLRCGKGIISDFFRKSSLNDQQYSHAGIIVVEQGKVNVYHILGSASSTSDLKIEPVSEFCNSSKNRGFAVYRYAFERNKENQIIDFLSTVSSRKVRFDDQFNLATDSVMYCTELVYKMCLATVGYKLPHSLVNNRDYIGLDNLYQNDKAILVTKQTY